MTRPTGSTAHRVGKNACDLGDAITALDINPLICAPGGALATDVLVVPAAQMQ